MRVKQYVLLLLFQSSFIDIIEIPIDIPLCFKVTKDSVDNAIKNGIHFEFTYASTFHDRTSRRSLLTSSHNVVVFGRGNNLLLGRYEWIEGVSK